MRRYIPSEISGDIDMPQNFESPETKQTQLNQELSRFCASYNPDLTVEQNQRRLEILQRMEQAAEISFSAQGDLVFDASDPMAFQEYDNKGWKRYSTPEVIDALRGIRAHEKQDLDDAGSPETRRSSRDIISLPKDTNEMINQDQSIGIIEPFDLDKKKWRRWSDEVKLDSGEQVTLFEMFITKKLKELQARRNASGQLEIFDSEKGQHRKFSVDYLTRKVEGVPQFAIRHEGKVVSFTGNPLEFLNLFGKNLLDKGVLRNEDFRVSGGSSSSEVFNVHERRLGKSPVVSLTNNKESILYYIGHGKNIVGTDIPIDENLRLRMLDSETAGLVQYVHGKPRLLLTFKLLSEDEIKAKRERVAERYKGQGRVLDRAGVSGRTSVNAEEMKKRVKKYDITEYVPKRPDETDRDYANRVARLSDVEFVTKKFQQFFSEVGIGIHKLPWSEQLILANAITEERDKERLIEFARQYGVEGLRTFLACDYDSKMAGVVLGLGERSPDAAKIIFEKYNQIIDATKSVEDFVKNTFSEATSGSAVKAKETLLRRAKDLLASYKEQVSKKQALDSEVVSRELENIKTEILLFASGFKVATENGQIDFRKIPGVEFAIQDPKSINAQDKTEMRRIFMANRPGYNPKLLKETVGEFEASLNTSGKEFYVLKYGGEIVAFIRFDQLANGNLYAGSLNVRPEVRGSSIGSAMLHQTLDKKAATHDIEAVVYSKNPMLKHYTSDFGFQIAGEIPDYHGTGQLFYKLFRPKVEALDKAA